MIKYGDKSEDVKRLQELLVKHAALPTQLPLDGDYGPNTARGVLYLKHQAVHAEMVSGGFIKEEAEFIAGYDPNDLQRSLRVHCSEDLIDCSPSLPSLPTKDEIQLIPGGPEQWFETYAREGLGPGHLLWEMAFRESDCSMVQRGVLTCGCDPVVRSLDDVFKLKNKGFITSWGFGPLQLTTKRGKPVVDVASCSWARKYGLEKAGKFWPNVFYDESLMLQASADFLQQKFNRNDKHNLKRSCSYKNKFNCRECIVQNSLTGEEDYHEQRMCSWIRACGKWAGKDAHAIIRACHVTDAIHKKYGR